MLNKKYENRFFGLRHDKLIEQEKKKNQQRIHNRKTKHNIYARFLQTRRRKKNESQFKTLKRNIVFKKNEQLKIEKKNINTEIKHREHSFNVKKEKNVSKFRIFNKKI